MHMHFPPALMPGDWIGVTAPSSGVPEQLHPRLARAIANLKKRGYRVKEGACLRSQYKNKSADKFARAAELMAFLTDPEIKTVIPPWGGDLAIELLELLDFQLLASVEPTWFVGYSDSCTLHLPLTVLAGWGTLHGPNLMELGAAAPDKTTAVLWNILETPHGNTITQYASAAFQRGESSWRTDPDAGFSLTHSTEWQRLDGEKRALCFEGRLFGGCLEIISRLAGTPFGNLARFRQRIGDDGLILYFENVEMQPCEMARALFSLRLQGWFNNVRGIVIGRSAAPDTRDPNQLAYIDALHSALDDVAAPVIYDVDIGHLPPQISLVNGACASVYFSPDGSSVTQRW
ncbi:S66 peptidase family protein [uncultured Pluralibacter sp.]|uniref:S66 family peptidase n=1 Tax=uncultured Pluralibacter sp. TaxID=1490864 RepID=UPI00260F0493|nr:S66 peptidase family protein [uncultured Pluralibacter sp.]